VAPHRRKETGLDWLSFSGQDYFCCFGDGAYGLMEELLFTLFGFLRRYQRHSALPSRELLL
jgi:hypothetical protein